MNFYHYIPWHKKNIFWIESYLLDLLINKNNSLKFQDKLSEKMIDIDLFILGSTKQKKETLIEFFKKLNEKKYIYII